MSIKRIKNWSYPHNVESVEDVGGFLRRHHREHSEESTERLRDLSELVTNDIGIADDNLLEVDLVGGLIDDEILRATANGVESRTDAQVLAQLSGDAAAAFDFNDQNLTKVGTIALDGGQIAFPATAVPSADVNTQDDYEEKTWTPDLQFGDAKVGITYSTQAGLYTKIGRQVSVTSYIILTSKGSSNGDARVYGLPFPVKNVLGAYAAILIRLYNISFTDSPQGHVPRNTSYCVLEEITNAGTKSTLTDANFANNSILMLSLTYFTD